MQQADIVFACAHCGRWLESPPDLAGMLVECPACEEVVHVPAKSTPPVAGAPAVMPSAPSREAANSATVRIDLPPNLGLPPAPPRRRFVLRRPS